jgi:hypothetical protein
MFFKKETHPKTPVTLINNYKEKDTIPLFNVYEDGFSIGKLSIRLSNFYLNLNFIKAWILWSIPTVTANRYCSELGELNWVRWPVVTYGVSSLSDSTHYKIFYYESTLQNISSFRSSIDNMSHCGVYHNPLRTMDYSAMPSVKIGTYAVSNNRGSNLIGKCRVELERGIFQPILEGTENCINKIMHQAHQNCLNDFNTISDTLQNLCIVNRDKENKNEVEVFQCFLLFFCIASLMAGLGWAVYQRFRPLTIFEAFEKDYLENKPGVLTSFEGRLELINYDFDELPNEFSDITSRRIINYPVKLNHNDSHDAEMLMQWWKNIEKKISPLTRQVIKSIEPDFLLKEKIEMFVSNLEEQYYLKNTNNLGM